jgi:xanthine dehydrogenase accessory factor
VTMSCFDDTLVLIKAAGDLASGVAARLHRSGFPVVMTELAQPMMVRRTVSFGEAIYEGEFAVEGILACRVNSPDEARRALAEGKIPVAVDPEAGLRLALKAAVVVDAIMAKHNTGTRLADAPLVIGLGPGFRAGQDCHAVVETNRGHWLGRVIWDGEAEPNTGLPGEVAGQRGRRMLRAPIDGLIETHAAIGDLVKTDQMLARVGGTDVRAGLDGVLRGLIHDGLVVTAGLKIGDIDPRAQRAHCFNISDKSLAVAGGVLEAILAGKPPAAG